MMFTGTTQQQDTRFSDKEKKMMKQMKFGDCLNKRVDMSKVKLDVLRPWISKKITDILHIEDDVVVEFVYNQLEVEKYPCPKKMQINMTGFLNGRNARQFMGELWSLLLSAQDSESGIPAEFIQHKKEEIVRREAHSSLEQQQLRQSNDHSRDRDKEFDRDRDREREQRREVNSQRERELEPPTKALTESEQQVRSKLPVDSRSTSAEENSLGNGTKDNSGVNVTSGSSNATGGDASKSPKSRTAAAEAAAAKIRVRSPRRRSREGERGGVTHRSVSRERSPTDRRKNSVREKEQRRGSSRSPKRRSPDRASYQSRSRGQNARRPTFSRHKSRSPSPKKRQNRSSEGRASLSRRVSPPRRPHVSSHSSNSRSSVNGHEEAEKKTKTYDEKSRKPERGASSSRSSAAPSSPEFDKKIKDLKPPPSRSRSPNRKERKSPTPTRSSKSSARSPGAERRPRKKSRSASHDSSSISLSPEPNKDDFEIRKNTNSIQTKRHYRSNHYSSASSAERDMGRHQYADNRRRGAIGRRQSPYRRDSKMENRDGGRNQHSNSRRRSRSPRYRSRSPKRRSRSPRRFNRRRSPLAFRGRGGNHGGNRGRPGNPWRRSLSRGRGGMDRGRFERRFSPRRFSRERERRQSPSHTYPRNQSPRRYSPVAQHQLIHTHRSSREKEMSSRDRRSSPMGRSSHERERGREGSFDRWNHSKNLQKLNQRMKPEQSNWGDRETSVEAPTKISARTRQSSRPSPPKSDERCDPNVSSFSEQRHRETSSSGSGVKGGGYKSKDRYSMEHSDIAANKSTDMPEKEKTKPNQRKNVESAFQVESRKPDSRDKYDASLSRTPSPFLKPHEREALLKTDNTGALLSTNKMKKPTADLATNSSSGQKRYNSDDSSTTESSSDSDDSEEETEEPAKIKRAVDTKAEMARQSRKRPSSVSSGKAADSDNESSTSNESREMQKNKRAKMQAQPAGNNLVKSLRKNSASYEKGSHGGGGSDLSSKRKGLETRERRDSRKASIDNGSNTTSKDTLNEERGNPETKADTTARNVSSSTSKQSSTTSTVKKTATVAESSVDHKHAAKKKKKKTKKSTKRTIEEDSSSDSDTGPSAKKKKHKKHKKHSKKSKKHKKHKKRSKKTDSSSSSDDDDDDDDGHDRSNDKAERLLHKMQADSGISVGGINDDLEKKLRERALKSLKKLD